tara:strand:- start:1138 stop:1695 length:558 start_codon:yes stop_codon:yes gene_type:complete
MPKIKPEGFDKDKNPAKFGRKITPQQQRFINNYLHKDMTQTASAREAGYKNPNVSAVQLLNHPFIRERIEEQRQELETKYGVTITKSVRDMQRLRDEAWAAGRYSDAIRAEELRLKATGLLVAKSHVVHENVDGMNRDDIVKKLQEYMERAKDRMVDVTPTENPTKSAQVPITDCSKEKKNVGDN